MPVEPGRLIGRGRAADVFEAGPGRVLRRYRTEHDSVPEAELLCHLHRHGYPVPEVHDVAGRDMVMERVEGPVQLDDLKRRPWRVGVHGRILASLHERLDAVPVPSPSPVPTLDLGPVDGIVHLDLHPGNVILAPTGPVVIDWSNGIVGPRAFDVATTWLLLAAGVPDGGRVERVAAAVLRRRLLRSFLAAVDLDAARAALPAACARRLDDPNLRPEEVSAVRALAGSVTG